MELQIVAIEKPEDVNFILGQSHFIKTVEDLHEALVGTVPGIRFGVAFCESSGKCLVRWTGTDDAMIELAQKNALRIGAGHSFVVFLGAGYYPVNVLNAIKAVPEVARDLLRHRQSDAGRRRGNGPGSRHPGRHRWGLPTRRRRRIRHRLAQGPVAQDRLQALRGAGGWSWAGNGPMRRQLQPRCTRLGWLQQGS